MPDRPVQGNQEVKPSILAVDDTPAILYLLQMTLSKKYQVCTAASGDEALAATEKRTFDMILLDLMMPGIDGLETLRRLRQQPNFGTTPVIFLTAVDDLSSERTALELGADDYIIKPFKPTLVQLRIANLLQRARLQQELELALASADQGIWEWDLGTGAVQIDARRGEKLGLGKDHPEAGELNWANLCRLESRKTIEQAKDEYLSGSRAVFDVDAQLLKQNGEWVWVNLYGKANRINTEGQVVSIKGTFRNIELRKAAENALTQSEERLRYVMEATGEGIWDWLIQSDTVTHNGSWCRLLGLDENHISHPVSFFKSLIHPEDQDEVERGLIACLGGEIDYTCEYRMRHADGHEIWVLDKGKVVERSAAGAPIRMVGSVRDITERRMVEAEFKRLALFDPLTGLPNRRLLVDRLQQAIAQSRRNSLLGAVMFIDLDRFKQLNDTLGHDFGDMLLIEVGRRLSTCIRKTDTVARLGGDEFIVMLAELSVERDSSLSSARIVAEKILEALNVPYQLGVHLYHSTPSIGLAMFSSETPDIDTVLKQADAAMYESKAAGRNCLRISSQIEPTE